MLHCLRIMLKGVAIGRGAVVAAGSAASQVVPPGAIVVGVPTRVLGNTVNANNQEDALRRHRT